MCRSIVTLRDGAEVHDRAAMEAAALQFVRKVSGFRRPSRANQTAFDEAVLAIADATEALMSALEIRA
jgi:hypothetical protein